MNDKVNAYLVANAKYFPTEKLPYIKEKLLAASEDQLQLLYTIDLKDPTMILIISIIGGGLGIDRFMIGDTGMGVLKLLTGGVCGILAIIDWFTISGKTREVNFSKLMMLI